MDFIENTGIRHLDMLASQETITGLCVSLASLAINFCVLAHISINDSLLALDLFTKLVSFPAFPKSEAVRFHKSCRHTEHLAEIIQSLLPFLLGPDVDKFTVDSF